MADLATLMIAVDSRPVKEASGNLDKMATSAGNTGKSVDALIAANARMATALATSNKPLIDATRYLTDMKIELERVGKSSSAIKAMEIKMAAARAPTAELAQEIRDVGAKLLIAERNAKKTIGDDDNGIVGLGSNSKLAKHHVQNLTFQFQDMFVGLASGQKPMTVFLQQGTQIAGIMSQAEIGVKDLIKAILDMVKATALAIATNPYFLALAAAIGTAYVAFKDFQDEIADTGVLKDYAKTLGLTAEEMEKLGPIGITAMDVIKGIWKTISDGLGLAPVFEEIGKFFSDLFRGVVDVSADAMAAVYGLFEGTYKGIVKVWGLLPAAMGDLAISAVNAVIDGMNGMLDKAIASVNLIISGANKILAKLEMPTIGLIPDADIPKIQNSYAGAANKAANAFVWEVRSSMTAARGALSDVGDTVSNNIIDAAKNRLADQAEGIIDKRSEDGLKKGAEKAGQSAAEKMMAKFYETAQKQYNEAMTGLFEKFSTEEIYLNIGIDVDADYTKIIEDSNKKRDEQIKKEREALKENMKLAEDGAKIIGDIIGGSAGKAVVGVLDVIKNEFPKLFADIGGIFGDVKKGLDDILASFGTSFQELDAGAKMGKAMDNLLDKIGIKSSNTGAQIGGSIGSAVGGPIGAIAGSILGGVVGGLLKKTKKASATIEAAAGNLNVGAIVGNNAKFKETANTLAGAVIDGINKIADQLGAEITDQIDVSIGQRKKKFTVDITGGGRTKGTGVYKFDTEAEAVEFAIRNAIQDGVLGGLRASTQALIKGAGDLEEQLAKAMDFEGVFKSLRAETDPLGVALETLDKRFGGLILTFTEAGATAEEWVDLEKYYQLEREKAIKEGNAKALEAVQAARDQLTEAYNRESEAILTTLQRFQDLTADLESFRLSLAEQLMTAEEIYKAAKTNFDEVAKLAAEGNQKAIEDLISVSQKYLDASKDFLTPEEYNREIENVMKAVDLAIAKTKTMEDYAQLQLDALNNSVDGLITVNESVISVRDAIKSLQDAIAKVPVATATALTFTAPVSAATSTTTGGAMPDFTKMTPDEAAAWYQGYFNNQFTAPMFADGGIHSGGLRLVGENGPELEVTGPSRIYNANQTAAMLGGSAGVEQQLADLRAEMRASLYAIAKNTGKTSDQLQRWDGDGLPDTRTWTI